MIKKILFPADGSKCSDKAFRYALEIAEKFGAELVIINVMDSRIVASAEMAYLDEKFLNMVQQNAKDEANKIFSRLGRECQQAGIKYSSQMLSGIPFEQIIDFATDNKVDIIIMGTHGRTGLARMLLGSTAEKVIRKAHCPVLTVRPDECDFLE